MGRVFLYLPQLKLASDTQVIVDEVDKINQTTVAEINNLTVS